MDEVDRVRLLIHEMVNRESKSTSQGLVMESTMMSTWTDQRIASGRWQNPT